MHILYNVKKRLESIMKHQIIYKNKDRYSSFPLLKRLDDRILIGFFTAPVPDHMGLFWWHVWESFDQGETWQDTFPYEFDSWDWPAASPREIYDCFAHEFPFGQIMTGSYGFMIKKEKVHKSKSLFYRWSPDNWKEEIYQRFYEIPNADIVLTFPRVLHTKSGLILVPAYALFPQYDMSRCFVWRSEDNGKNFHLFNMFPGEVDGNEMAFVKTEKGILAHIRSDKHPFIMESWSFDRGITWTYPTNIYCQEDMSNIIGGPSHLLRLKDGKILCTYGYRQQPMGIQAIISEDEGETWQSPIILRDDGGYLSSLHKRTWKNKFKLPHPGNDIGYPVSIQLDDESILTAYYITCKDRITGIEMTKWKL